MIRRVVAPLVGAALIAALTLAPTVTGPAEAATPITVSGVVTDQLGNPVPGTTVDAINYAWRGDWETFGSTVTDAGGHYSFTFDPHHRVDGEPLWAVTLRVQGPDHWQKYVDLPDYAPGDSLVVDVEVEERPHVTGVVTDESGAPLVGAKVHFHNVATEGDEECSDEYGCPLGWWNDRDVTTDAEGRFSTWAHPRDLIGVVVSAPGFESYLQYDAVAGDHLEVRLVPGDPGFEPMTITGVVRDPSGLPAPEVEVTLYSSSTPRILTTDAAGRYEVSLDPVAFPGWAHGLVLDADVDGIYGARAEVPPAPSGYYEPATHHDIDLTFEEPGRVQGVVTDEQGVPVSGVEVRTYRRTVLTGSDGRYDLAIRPGTYTLSFYAPLSYGGYAYVTVAGGEVVEPPQQVIRFLPRPPRPEDLRAEALGPRRAEVTAHYDAGDSLIRVRIAQCRGRYADLRRARVDHYQPEGLSSITVGRLEPGKRYRCRVRARSDVGWSPWSAYSEPFRTPR